MAARFFPRSTQWFYDGARERSGRLPFVVVPAFWTHRRRPGPSLTVWRLTLAWGRRRWHLHIGCVVPTPSRALSDPALGLQRLPVPQAARAEAEAWLVASPWAPLMRWGGARSHYGRLVLARAFESRRAPGSSRGPMASPGSEALSAPPRGGVAEADLDALRLHSDTPTPL